MQRSRSSMISSPKGTCLGNWNFSSYIKRLISRPKTHRQVLQRALSPFVAYGAVQRVRGQQEFKDIFSPGFDPLGGANTTIPSVTGVVQAVSSFGPTCSFKEPSSRAQIRLCCDRAWGGRSLPGTSGTFPPAPSLDGSKKQEYQSQISWQRRQSGCLLEPRPALPSIVSFTSFAIQITLYLVRFRCQLKYLLMPWFSGEGSSHRCQDL
jgi:hypothetical protein